jgi:hypothetical protein
MSETYDRLGLKHLQVPCIPTNTGGSRAVGARWRIDFDFKSERFSYLSDPRGFRIFGIQKVFVCIDIDLDLDLGSKGFRIF